MLSLYRNASRSCRYAHLHHSTIEIEPLDAGCGGLSELLAGIKAFWIRLMQSVNEYLETALPMRKSPPQC